MPSPADDLIAWAAGLYDGEGSASMYVPKLRITARRQMQVSQAGVAGILPEVLVRFDEIVGAGNITGPYRGYLFYWKTTRSDAIDNVAMMLWPYLSREKRRQFETMTREAGLPPRTMPPTRRVALTEIAWAAGLFDGEGSIIASGRAGHPGIQLELSQASAHGVPDTLRRFHSIVDRGAVKGPYPPRSPWSRLPQYRWSVAGRHQATAVLELLWPWLSLVKRRRTLSFAGYLDSDFADSALTRT